MAGIHWHGRSACHYDQQQQRIAHSGERMLLSKPTSRQQALAVTKKAHQQSTPKHHAHACPCKMKTPLYNCSQPSTMRTPTPAKWKTLRQYNQNTHSQVKQQACAFNRGRSAPCQQCCVCLLTCIVSSPENAVDNTKAEISTCPKVCVDRRAPVECSSRSQSPLLPRLKTPIVCDEQPAAHN